MMHGNTPEISVVMSVYNGADELARTIDSILAQDGVDMEFIIIDDGSTDHSLEILQDYQRKDPRIVLLPRENQGLTKALIRGCEHARGEYIARQDVGDVSLPGRLETQRDFLRSRPEVVLVSCGTRFVGPQDELLYDILDTPEEAKQGLHKLNLKEIRGPSHHGSTMFRRSAYMKAGGYRPQFRVAQDLDLWLRLVEQGQHATVPKIFYQAKFMPNSISARRRKQQIKTTQLIIICAQCRHNRGDELVFLEQAACIPASPKVKGFARLERAKAFYFIARCLEKKDTKAAISYYHQALAEFPFHLKSVWCLLLHKVST